MSRAVAAWLFVGMFAVAACGRGRKNQADGGRTGPPEVPDASVPKVGLEKILQLEDARDVEGLAAFAATPDDAERARIVLALGRTQSDGARQVLRRALLDEAAAVRDAAAFAIGLLGKTAGPEEERALLGRLAAERHVLGRAALVDALGRVGRSAALPALAALLQDPEAEVRERAALALGFYGVREVEIGPERIVALGERVGTDTVSTVRVAAAFALSRTKKLEGDPARTAAAALEQALDSSDADLRMMSAKAVGRVPGSPTKLLRLSDDADWRVRVNAVRALPGRAGPRAAAASLRAALHEVWQRAGAEGIDSPTVHPLAAALEVAADLMDNPGLRTAVQEIHEKARSLRGPATARDLIHCWAAYDLDRAGNWPRFVTTCGTPTMSAWRRTVLEARVLGSGHGDDDVRAGRLAKILETARDVHSRLAIVEAASSIDHPLARRIIVDALADEDPGVAGVAAEGVTKIAASLVRLDAASIREATTPDGREPASATVIPDPVAVDRLVALVERYRDGGDEETLISVVGALGALKASTTAARLVPLLRHPTIAVRQAAADAYYALSGEEAPRSGPPLAQRRPLDVRPAAELLGRAVGALIKTTRGDIRLELDPGAAPGTVLNFVSLARQGFYRGTTFHRVVSNFVIQGGDPRGDGYGGPGYSIRCEPGPGRYTIGSVGMALAGADTGGAQFFITHSTQPHLDGRYTLFGRVRDGQDVADRIVPGDVIAAVTIE